MTPGWFQQPTTNLSNRANGGAPNSTGLPPPVGNFFLALNLSGAESNTGFPSLAELLYWANQGMTILRIPLSWTLIQPTINGPLSPTYTASISTMLANAAAAGVRLLLDWHNFGNAPNGLKLGTITGTQPIAAFANGWLAFSRFLRADPNFASVWGYDIMNEWNAMDINNPSVPSNTYSQGVIFACNQLVVTTLRADGDNTLLILEWDHFDGAWDAVTNNIEMLFAGIVDPANNWMGSVHCYLDYNSSGTQEVWSQVISTPGEAPPGLDVTVNIGPQRMAAVVALAQQHGRAIILGETGFTSDNVYVSGANDYADWNQAGFNMISYCQANKIPVFAWASGPGFNPQIYAYSPAPFLAGSPSTKDFTSGTGVQNTQVVVYEQFSGYSGAQPTAYTASPPYANGSPVIPYAPSGTPLGGYFLYYGGVIPSEVTITGTATLPDGTNAGGTFSSLNMAPGQNGLVSFSYTPSGAHAGISLSFTNNVGWTNPPAVSISSLQDFFSGTIGAIASNIYFLRRLNNSYIGPAIRLQRATDGAQMDFFFNVAGDLPRQAIQDWASSRTIQIITLYDQSGAGNNLAFNSTLINLILVDATGYPSILISGAVIAVGNTPSIGQGAMTLYTEVNPTNTGIIATQDFFLPSFRLTSNIFQMGPNNGSVTTVTVGASLNTWSDIAGTYNDGYSTNNLKSYIAGSLAHQITAPQFANAAVDPGFNIFNFQFGDVHYLGSARGLMIQYLEYSAAELSTLHTLYNTYYTTALPDSLTATAPTIVNGAVPNNSIFSGIGGQPFLNVSIRDDNPGSPTDTVTITLSGAAATLTGSGISGTNPYTIASASPASLTTTLHGLTLNTSATAGSSITIVTSATSSAGPSASTTMPITIQAYTAETPFAAPVGTFTPVNLFGVNLAGGENTGVAPNGQLPQNFELDYFASKGFGLIRLPITSQFAQTTAFGLLNSGYMSAIKSVIDHAFTLNLYIVIDPHDFGTVWNSTAGAKQTILPGTITQLLFNDEWVRLMTKFKNYPNVIFGLQNEPVGMTVAQWFTSASECITAARTASGATQLITIPGGATFTGAHDWVSSGNGAAWAGYAGDPANNFIFEMHQYLDSGNSGGSPVATQNGTTILAAATAWLVTNSFQACLYEFGMAPDPWFPINLGGNINNYDPAHGITLTTNSITQNGNMLTYMKTNRAQWPSWAEWSGGIEFAAQPVAGGYCFNPEPARPYPTPIIDQPQIAVLQAGL